MIRCFGWAIEVAEGMVVREWNEKEKPYKMWELGEWPETNGVVA